MFPSLLLVPKERSEASCCLARISLPEDNKNEDFFPGRPWSEADTQAVFFTPLFFWKSLLLSPLHKNTVATEWFCQVYISKYYPEAGTVNKDDLIKVFSWLFLPLVCKSLLCFLFFSQKSTYLGKCYFGLLSGFENRMNNYLWNSKFIWTFMKIKSQTSILHNKAKELVFLNFFNCGTREMSRRLECAFINHELAFAQYGK